MWEEPLRNGRCILPAATFFEPHETQTTVNPKTGRTVKRQFEFSLPDEEPLLLASVSQDGKLSVVTTKPNESVAPIHGRMPLALRFEEVQAWLEGDYDALADRSGIDLSVNPEEPEVDPSQLSLF